MKMHQFKSLFLFLLFFLVPVVAAAPEQVPFYVNIDSGGSVGGVWFRELNFLNYSYQLNATDINDVLNVTTDNGVLFSPSFKSWDFSLNYTKIALETNATIINYSYYYNTTINTTINQSFYYNTTINQTIEAGLWENWSVDDRYITPKIDKSVIINQSDTWPPVSPYALWVINSGDGKGARIDSNSYGLEINSLGYGMLLTSEDVAFYATGDVDGSPAGFFTNYGKGAAFQALRNVDGGIQPIGVFRNRGEDNQPIIAAHAENKTGAVLRLLESGESYNNAENIQIFVNNLTNDYNMTLPYVLGDVGECLGVKNSEGLLDWYNCSATGGGSSGQYWENYTGTGKFLRPTQNDRSIINPMGATPDGNAWYDMGAGGILGSFFNITEVHSYDNIYGDDSYNWRGNTALVPYQWNTSVGVEPNPDAAFLVFENLQATRENRLNGYFYSKIKQTEFYQHDEPRSQGFAENRLPSQLSLLYPYVQINAYSVTFTRPYELGQTPAVICTCGVQGNLGQWLLWGGRLTCHVENPTNTGFTGYCQIIDPADPGGQRLNLEGEVFMNWQAIGAEDTGTNQMGKQIEYTEVVY